MGNDDVDPLLGTTVAGRFRLVAQIGRGGMGAVYRAVQSPLERECALKLIRNDVVDALARKRFEREARIAASIDDPRVATVYDFGSTPDGTLFLAMELVHGVTLRERLARGPLQWKEAAHVVREVARALGAAHAKGLVHRDLKPENIMLANMHGPDGARVKVLDFGLAKEIADLAGINERTGVSNTTLTRAGAFVGTPGYVAPETLKGAAEDPRQDVFSLGVLLWECIVGRHPFAADTPLETIVRSMQEDLPPLEEGTRRIAGAPVEVSALLASLCARDPAERPRHGDDVARLIDALRGEAHDSSDAFPANDARDAGARRELAQDGSAPPLVSSLPTLDAIDDSMLPAGAVRKSDANGAAPATPTSTTPMPPLRAKRARFESLDPEEVTEPAVVRSAIGRVDEVAAALARNDARPAAANGQGQRFFRLAAASVAFAIVAVVAFLATRDRGDSARARDEATKLALSRVEAALASGNAAVARVQLRDVLVHDDGKGDGARTRALWSASLRADRVVDVVLDGRITDVTFVDEHHVAVANRNTTIDVVDVRTGARTKLRGHADEVIAVAAAPTGELASCDILGDVRRWNASLVATNSDKGQSRKPSDRRCYGVDFAPGGKTLWITDGAVARWGAPRPGAAPTRHVLGVIGVDETRALGWSGPLLMVFEGDAAQEVARRDAGSPVRSVTATTRATERVFYAGLTDGRVVRFHVDGSDDKDQGITAFTDVRTHGARVETLAVSSDGALLASAGNNEAVRIGPPDGAPHIALVDGPPAPIAMSFSPDSKHLAIVARDRLVVYDVAVLIDENRASDAHRRTVEALDIASDGKALWTGGADGALIRWDTARARGRVQLRVDATIEDIDVAPDDRTVALALSDGRALVVDAGTGEERAGWIHPGGATSVAFSADGALLATGGRDGRVFLAGQDRVPTLLSSAQETGNAILSLAIGGGVVAQGGERGLLQVHEARIGGKQLFNVHLPKCGTVFSLRADDEGIYAPCNDGRLELRRLSALNTTIEIAFADTRIYDVDIRNDMRIVAGAHGVWISNPRAKGTLRQVSTQRNVNRARSTRDGATVYTTADDMTVRRISLDDAPDAWDLDVARIVPAAQRFAGLDALRGARLISVNDRFVCAVDAGGVHTWSVTSAALGTETRALGVTVPDAPITGIAATSRGCAVSTTRGVRFLVDGNEVARTQAITTALASDNASNDVLVLGVGSELSFVDATGSTRAGGVTLPEGAAITAVAISQRDDHRRVLVGRADGSAFLVADGQVRTLTVDKTQPVTAAALLPRNVVALGFDDGTVRAFDHRGDLVDTARLHGSIAHLSFTPEGMLAATTLGDVAMRMRALDDERCALLEEVARTTALTTPCDHR